MSSKGKRIDPVLVDKDAVLVDCYRFKIEITDQGYIRFYAFNSWEKGDIEITIKLGKILLVREIDGQEEEILKERTKEIVYKKVFGSSHPA